MNLPEPVLLNQFNKVLITLSEICPNGEACSVESLIYQCKSIVFGGQIVDYNAVIEYCKQGGFIQLKKNRINITSLGQKFIDANREKFFEINEAQKNLIASKIVFNGGWSNIAREFFGFFSPNFSSENFELSLFDTTLPNNFIPVIHLFKYLGILRIEDTTVILNKKYSELLFHLTVDSKAVSEIELERILIENSKLGAIAEKAIVQFEKRRLLALGKSTQAMLVRRISPFNAAAGFDIESFDGKTDDLTPNRFIEVKATQGDEFRFYWTNNEQKVAKRLKESYWIYFIGSFRENDPERSNPILIKNPYFEIPKKNYLSMETHTLLIKEKSELLLEEQRINDVNWFIIC